MDSVNEYAKVQKTLAVGTYAEKKRRLSHLCRKASDFLTAIPLFFFNHIMHDRQCFFDVNVFGDTFQPLVITGFFGLIGFDIS